MPLRLPYEILEAIVRQAAHHNPSQQWIIEKESDKPRWEPLRALSQTSRELRRQAMPLLWKDVAIDASEENWTKLQLHIEQLKAAIQIGSYSLAPGALVESVRIQTTRPNEPREGATATTPDYTRPCTLRRYYEKDFRTSQHVSAVAVRSLVQVLAQCPRLTYFRWDGWLVPDKTITSTFANMPSLPSFEIGLGASAVIHQTQDGWQIDAGDEWNRLVFSASGSPEEHLMQKRSGMTTFCNGGYCDRCEDLEKCFQIVPHKGASTVDWLVAMGVPTRLSLAIPALLEQRWMIPLWAQIEDMIWQPEILDTDEEEDEDEWKPEEWEECWCWGTWPSPTPRRLELFEAARNFRRLLLKNVPPPVDREGLQQAAKCAFDMIHTKPQLTLWRPWLEEWSNEPGPDGTESTQQLMVKVVKALWRNS